MANKLDVSELDFLTIKNNFRVFLEDNSLFTDYNFEGSALDVLNSQLAYNTHYIGFYANMLFNEAFLDTAVKRASVVSIAKHLNYTPKSMIAATAIVHINIIPTGTPTDVFIPKGTAVSGAVDTNNYNFITLEDAIATPTGTGNVYRAEDVTLVQGVRRTLAYVKNAQDETQRFILPYTNIDTKYLEVTIQKEESDTTSAVWEYSDTILDITGDDEVYFLQETDGGRFEIYFGDGYLGKALEHGNVVFVDYLMTEGKDANNANSFAPVDSIGGTSNITFETSQVSVGGADPEDIEFIRRQAPRFYESQKRAVTARDYETLLLNDVSYIRDNFQSVQVWGGEKNIPPLYGNVIVSLQPKAGVTITNYLKEQIKSQLLDAYNVIGIIPIIMDPEYLYVEMDVALTYARNKTTLTRDELINNVKELILDWRDTSLALFEKTFRMSEISCLIDDIDPSMIGNLINLRVKRTETILFNQIVNYSIDFRNAIEPGTMQSAQFFISEYGQQDTDIYYFEDDRAGNVMLMKLALDNTVTTVNATFGTVNYETGDVELPCFVPINLVSDDEFWVSFVPEINDLYTVRNLILTINEADLTITATGIQS